jgi:hypothetical protein
VPHATAPIDNSAQATISRGKEYLRDIGRRERKKLNELADKINKNATPATTFLPHATFADLVSVHKNFGWVYLLECFRFANTRLFSCKFEKFSQTFPR